MNMGHMIRVWLQLPKQALCFYEQGLKNGMKMMQESSREQVQPYPDL